MRLYAQVTFPGSAEVTVAVKVGSDATTADFLQVFADK